MTDVYESEVTIARCACSSKCKLMAIFINDFRITPTKHSGRWGDEISTTVHNYKIYEALKRVEVDPVIEALRDE